VPSSASRKLLAQTVRESYLDSVVSGRAPGSRSTPLELALRHGGPCPIIPREPGVPPEMDEYDDLDPSVPAHRTAYTAHLAAIHRANDELGVAWDAAENEGERGAALDVYAVAVAQALTELDVARGYVTPAQARIERVRNRRESFFATWALSPLGRRTVAQRWAALPRRSDRGRRSRRARTRGRARVRVRSGSRGDPPPDPDDDPDPPSRARARLLADPGERPLPHVARRAA
jgi:hypothetical protein